MRPKALTDLLASVKLQTKYPDQIIIVDGSTNFETKDALEKTDYKNLVYYKVEEDQRGISLQRNFGMTKVTNDMKIVCFLDDDIILTPKYFNQLVGTYEEYPNASAVGGYITNEVSWTKLRTNEKITFKQYESDGWVRDIGLRNVIRKKLGLLSDKPPGYMPEFSNGFSIGYIPPNGKVYPVEYFMGGVSSFKKEVIDTIKFSNYFIGYGLYEDLEYCNRVSRQYKLYINTSAQLSHYHEAGGRPSNFLYGKMVVRNGWYVWRARHPKPSFKAKFKWNTISLVLTFIRLSNVLTSKNKKAAITESMGRFYGLLSLIFNKPKNSY
tara:strand:+ start:13048 stop:14019 length:972 start_codon:yes stop_codon:yes gene_type:complete